MTATQDRELLLQYFRNPEIVSIFHALSATLQGAAFQPIPLALLAIISHLPEDRIVDAVIAALKSESSIRWAPSKALGLYLFVEDDSGREALLTEICYRIREPFIGAESTFSKDNRQLYEYNAATVLDVPYWEHPQDAWDRFEVDVKQILIFARDVLHFTLQIPIWRRWDEIQTPLLNKKPILDFPEFYNFDGTICCIISAKKSANSFGGIYFRVGHTRSSHHKRSSETVFDVLHEPSKMQSLEIFSLEDGYYLNQAIRLRYLFHFPDVLFRHNSRLVDWSYALAIVRDLFGQDARFQVLQALMAGFDRDAEKDSRDILLSRYKVNACTALFHRLLNTAEPHDFSAWERISASRCRYLVHNFLLPTFGNDHFIDADKLISIDKLFFETYAPLNLLFDWLSITSLPSWIRTYLETVVAKRKGAITTVSGEFLLL